MTEKELLNAKKAKIKEIEAAGTKGYLTHIFEKYEGIASFELLKYLKAYFVVRFNAGARVAFLKINGKVEEKLQKISDFLVDFTDFQKTTSEIADSISRHNFELSNLLEISDLEGDELGNLVLFAKDTLGLKILTVKNLEIAKGCNRVEGILAEDLERIKIPGTVKEIKGFSNLSKLTNVEIEDGVEIIKREAFFNCKNLSSISIPDSVTQIENSVFKHTNLMNLNHPVIKINNGLVIQGDVLCYASVDFLEKVIIPPNITKIGLHAFAHSAKLKKVSIPDSVVEIGQEAFVCCEKLSEINLPPNLKKIEFGTFLKCYSLEKIIIPESVTEICLSAFNKCRKLTDVIISDNVEKIESYAFCDCNIKNLQHKAITIKDGYVIVDKKIEYTTYNVENVEIPDGITELENCAFMNCKHLKSIKIPESVEKMGEEVFFDCSLLEEVILPSKITVIDKNLFNGCISLKKVVIPSSVKEIGNNAFRGCSHLKTIQFNGTKEQWENITGYGKLEISRLSCSIVYMN